MQAEVVVPFTGAGISTECGIPDFRSPGGIWTKMRPIEFGDFLASQEARDESWRRRFAMEDQFGGAKPGRGHRALASLYKAGKIPGIITQNIDNLHQVSGFSATDVVELHGNTTYATCLDCAKRYELAWVREHFDRVRRPFARLPAVQRLYQDRDCLIRPVDAGGCDAARPGADRIVRPVPRHRLVASRLAGRRISARCKTSRRTPRHHQSRCNRLRRRCRSCGS